VAADLDLDEGRIALAGATARQDGPAIMAVLVGHDPGPLLQHAGAGLLVALAQQVEGAADLVPGLVEALAQRGADGDTVLAEQLLAATSGPPTGREPLAVDLEMLIDVLEGDLNYGYGGFLDLTTGIAWPEMALTNDRPDDLDLEDPEKWLVLPHLGSHEAWRDMRDFAVEQNDPALAELLLDAIDGRGAFSRFRRVLDRHPEQISAWRAFSDDRRVGRARSWLADAGYDAIAGASL
jgi:Uncharacterised protein family (UPF0158)